MISNSILSSPVSDIREQSTPRCGLILRDGKTLDMFIRVEDGYLHATKIAQVYNKRPIEWLRCSNAKALIKRIEKESGKLPGQVVETYKGNSRNIVPGTWIHPSLIIPFIAWCSSDLQSQIFRYYQDLLSPEEQKYDSELNHPVGQIPQSKEKRATSKNTHEYKFKQFLDAHQELYTFNRQSADDPSICGRYRPDFLFKLPTHCIIIEVDEKQHKSEDPRCEIIRTIKIAHGLGLHTIFLRYNPDGNSKPEIVLDRLRFYKQLLPSDLETMPMLKIEYFGYTSERMEMLQEIDEHDLLADPAATIDCLKETVFKKDKEIADLMEKLKVLTQGGFETTSVL